MSKRPEGCSEPSTFDLRPSTARRRRVLILVSRFPPFDTPEARRALGLYRHLPAHGWQPWVLTADPRRIWNPYSHRPADRSAYDPSRVQRTGFSLAWHAVNRLGFRGLSAAARMLDTPALERAAELFRFPDAEQPWIPYAVAEGLRLDRRVGFDAIISTSPPPSAHLAARALKALLHERPAWIADFRDPWSQETTRLCWNPPWRLDARLEAAVLRGADGLVAVSPSWAADLARLGTGRPVATVLNGYDPADYAGLRSAPRGEKLRIGYAGIGIPGLRDPVPMVRAVARVLAEGTLARDRIEVRCFGLQDPALDRAVAELGLADVVHVEPRQPRHQVLEQLAEAAVLWNMSFSDRYYPGNIPSKVFEYFGLRRHVLSTGGNPGDDLEQILTSSGAGERVDNDEQAIAACLRRLAERFEAHGPRAFVLPEQAVAPFTHQSMARRFAEQLDTLTPAPGARGQG